jgi:stringent starvation protein B
MDGQLEEETFDTVFGYACAGTVVLLCAVAIIYLLLGIRQFSYRKRVHGNTTSLTVTANRDLFRVAVAARFNGEEIKFERRRIRKGQAVEFDYPRSDRKATLTVEVESGRARAYEV